MSKQDKLSLNTSQKYLHVFACNGTPQHVYPGKELLKAGKAECPECGKPVTDITNTPLGRSYFAFARPDLGKK